MGRTQKKTSIEERRKQKRECEKRRREKIKNDEVKREEQKKKDHERYQKNKEKGIIKLVKDLSRREKKAKRKKWAENQKRHRNKIRMLQNTIHETPPESDDENNLSQEQPNERQNLQVNSQSITPLSFDSSFSEARSSNSRQKNRGRTLVRRDRAKCYKKLQKVEQEYKNLKRKSEVWKKRFYRLGKKRNRTSNQINADEASPNTKVQEIVKGYNVPSEVKKKLLFGEVIRKELSTNFKKLATQSSKQIFTKVINGRLLRKYRLLKEAQSFLPHKLYSSNKKRSNNLTYEKEKVQKVNRIQKIVMDYYLTDESSRVCPGKKDTITKKGTKKQKRYLNNNMKILFSHFQKTHNIKISYSTFCKLRPFWVVPPKVSARDTCLCITHENIEMVISTLYRLKIIVQKSSQEVLNALCCDIKNESCLSRDCKSCRSKKLLFNVTDDMWKNSYSYQKWETKHEKRLSSKTNKEITVKITFKSKVEDQLENIIAILNNSLPRFLNHILNINHQYVAITELKKKLKDHELLLHIDFSENFSCKYASEVQSVHFGASRAQVALHTGVMYHKSGKEGFCTISESLRHDPCAIVAHLIPILTYYLDKLGPTISTLHILSDGPSTQYRNRKICYLLTSYLPNHFPTINKISWNYSEAGHGKGAPDGIGAVIKRSADQAVAHNNDINSFETFAKVIRESDPNVHIDFVTPDEITTVENVLPVIIPICKGIMKVHQVTWRKDTGILYFNALSCFSCELGTCCKHYEACNPKTYATSIEIMQPKTSEVEEPTTTVTLAPKDKENSKELIITLISRPEEEEIFKEPTTTVTSALLINDWIAAIFDDHWYPGIIENISDGKLIISFMIRKGNGFNWPMIPDRQTLDPSGILCKLKVPPVPVSTRLFQVPESKYIDDIFNKV